MDAILNDLRVKCLYVWNNLSILKNNKQPFTVEEVACILEQTAWTQRKNFVERVLCMSLGWYEVPLCPITRAPFAVRQCIHLTHYTREHLVNKCFAFNKVLITDKLRPPFYVDYNHEEVERIFRSSNYRTIPRYPLLVNHCWASLERRGADVGIIESNEEAIYLHTNNITPPLCNITGLKRKFAIHRNSYQEYATVAASHIANGNRNRGKVISEDIKKKRTETMIGKYGVSNLFEVEEVRQKGLDARRAKFKAQKEQRERDFVPDPRTPQQKYGETMVERYGVTSNLLIPRSKEKEQERQEKVRKTVQERFGVDSIGKSKVVRGKVKKTCLERYGVTCALNTPNLKSKRKIKKRYDTYLNFARFSHISKPEFTLEEWMSTDKEYLPWRSAENNRVFLAKYNGYPPIGKFDTTSIERAIHRMLDSMNIKYELYNRTRLSPYELDIYLPCHNIAIECNGMYYHSDYFIDRGYHQEKKRYCEEHGIRLLAFWERDIKFKSRIVKSIIQNTLKKNKCKVPARKCTTRDISSKQSAEFVNKHHIQGTTGAKYHVGLYFNNKLVSVATFSKPRFSKNATDINEVELIRFCSRKGVTVIGALGKLISHFCKIHKNVKSILTYADNSLFSGVGYKVVGFVYSHLTEPDYFYSKYTQVLSRYQCQKHKLKKLLKTYDPKLSEYENMRANSYCRIYGYGQHVLRLNVNYRSAKDQSASENKFSSF